MRHSTFLTQMAVVRVQRSQTLKRLAHPPHPQAPLTLRSSRQLCRVSVCSLLWHIPLEVLIATLAAGFEAKNATIYQMISDIDQDGSGSIEFDEFLDMMTAKMVC